MSGRENSPHAANAAAAGKPYYGEGAENIDAAGRKARRAYHFLQTIVLFTF